MSSTGHSTPNTYEASRRQEIDGLACTEKRVGPRERVGNKGGTLGNRLRAVMAGKK